MISLNVLRVTVAIFVYEIPIWENPKIKNRGPPWTPGNRAQLMALHTTLGSCNVEWYVQLCADLGTTPSYIQLSFKEWTGQDITNKPGPLREQPRYQLPYWCRPIAGVSRLKDRYCMGDTGRTGAFHNKPVSRTTVSSIFWVNISRIIISLNTHTQTIRKEGF